MSKEMMIVFVYDTLRCLAESDDPADAVLYFHPSWVSDSQRMSLCGQLMGVTHCLKAMFSTPQILSLHSGKFVIQEYGRYVLAVGSDRNIPDWVLQSRSKILVSLIQIFHCDLQTLATHFPGENNPRFSQKLYQIFETYLPTLYHGYYMFQTLPLLNLPKSATSIFLESMQLLDFCRQTNGVIGGAVLYNNKILATQLTSKLTSRLCMIDPFRIKLPAESLNVEYEIPIGAQLFAIFIKKSTYESLKKNAERIRSWQHNSADKIKSNKALKAQKEPILGAMKRDKSLLFTAVPEEDIHSNSTSPSSPKEPIDLTKTSTKESTVPSSIPDVVPFSMKPRVRPNKLALSFITRDSIEEDPKPSVAPGPVFTGQTSVCSTPMLEFKRLHGNVMSICRTDDQAFAEALNAPPAKSPDLSPSEIEDLKLKFDEITHKDIVDMKEETTKELALTTKELKVTNENVVYKPTVNMRKIKSLTDINNSFKKFSYLAAMRLGKSGVTNKIFSVNSDESPTDEIENSKLFNMTITDPLFPVFTNEGVPISRSLYNQYLTMHYDEMTKESKLFEEAALKAKKLFEDFDMNMKTSPVRRQSLIETKSDSLNQVDAESPTKPDMRRKSLCLPLKSLGSDKGELNLFDSSQDRKKLAGVQLTPLIEKLSHTDKSSGYGSRGVTPMEFRDFQLSTPLVEKTIVFPEPDKKKETKSESSESESEDETQISSYGLDSVKITLFVCGLHNMSMILLIDQEVAMDQKPIQSLCDACTASLTTIEQMCMEPLPGCEDSSEAYSFLSLDPQWGAVKKGGPWASADVATMGYIHNDFQQDSDLTEFIVRNEDSLVFGTSCGGAEIYYQEGGCKQPGLPTPADIMGTAPLKAKRRLQRDHSVTIF